MQDSIENENQSNETLETKVNQMNFKMVQKLKHLIQTDLRPN